MGGERGRVSGVVELSSDAEWGKLEMPWRLPRAGLRGAPPCSGSGPRLSLPRYRSVTREGLHPWSWRPPSRPRRPVVRRTRKILGSAAATRTKSGGRTFCRLTVETAAASSGEPRPRPAHTCPARRLVHHHGELVQVGPSQRPRGPAPRPDPLPHRQARPVRRLRPGRDVRARVLAVRPLPRSRRPRQGQGHRSPRGRDGR